MRLILTRHGETEDNVKGIIQGHSQGILSLNGIKQAKKLANRLKYEKIDVIFSSDLKRAADTAREIAFYHKDIPLIFTEKLRERNFGSSTGKHKDMIDWDNLPPDTETAQELHKRAKSILIEAYEKYPQKTVLFVSHGGFSRIIVNVVLEQPEENWHKIDRIANTSISIFEITGSGSKMHILNCTRHLK
jgi:broad specificity phosphatase PhoE